MIPEALISHRLAALRARMANQNIDALLVSNPENRQYITGFYGHDSGADSAGRVLIAPDQILLFTDPRYGEQAREEAPGIVISEKRDPLPDLVVEALAGWGWTATAPHVLGIEAEHLTVALFHDIASTGKALFRVQATRALIEPLRASKDASEIALTRRATEITVQTFAHLRRYLRKAGLTEQAVAAEIVRTMIQFGADDVAFPPIVAVGPNGARPHAKPGNRPLLPLQPIIIDMGARFQGYCADMTRTVFLDGIPDHWAQRYQHVLAALETGTRALRAGIAGKAVDDAVRAQFANIGLGDYFTHGLGHGTGLEIHEDPRLSPRAPEEDLLPAGAIVTIEPGLYFAGEGGIRIEDAAVVIAQGCEVLTTAPKTMQAMLIKRSQGGSR